MGLLKTIGKVASGVGDVVTDFIPGPIDDIAFKGVKNLIGGGGSSTPGISGLPALPQQRPRPPAQQQRQQQRPTASFQGPSGNLGPLQFQGPSAQVGGSSGGGSMVQDFQGALVLHMLQKSVRSKSGKSILKAMMAGSLEGGMIQEPQRVETVQGVKHFSPPGFRTITLNGQKVSVFKPLAKALGWKFNASTSELKKLDKQARKYLSNRRRVKKLAGKVGLKTSNRKSGPKR